MKKTSAALHMLVLAVLLFLRFFCIGWVADLLPSALLEYALQGIWSVLFALFVLFCFEKSVSFTHRFPIGKFAAVLLVQIVSVLLQYWVPEALVITLMWIALYLILVKKEDSFFTRPVRAAAVLVIVLVSAGVWSILGIMISMDAVHALDASVSASDTFLYLKALEDMNRKMAILDLTGFVCETVIGCTMILAHRRRKTDSDS